MEYENLNKENFWNEMMEKFPKVTKKFCDWIDEYKKKVNWNELFNGGILNGDIVGGEELKAPKFHDIPYEMQTGILNRFIMELQIDIEVEVVFKKTTTYEKVLAWSKLFSIIEKQL